MSWQDRVQPIIQLVSPSGIVFVATWKGDPRHLEKRLGIFDYPQLPGAVVQDLGVTATRWPLSFHFDGNDHDLDAAEFFTACAEQGVWTIDHPTLGRMVLQLISVTEEIQPVESGGVTAITSEWIEPIDGGLLVAGADRTTVDAVWEQTLNLEDVAVRQFATSKLTLLGQYKAALTTVNLVKNAIKKTRADIETTYRTIVNTIQTGVTDVVSLASEIQILVMLPGEMLTDLGTRFEFYGKLLTDILGVPDPAVRELVLTSCLVGQVRAILSNDTTSREEIISYIESLDAAFTTVTTNLDLSQGQQSGSRIDQQYFSQSQSFNDMTLLVAQTIELLLRRSYDLAVARRFTLTRNRCPVEIAITEGIDVDMFIATNHLKGDDILLLTAGRQVVIYL